MTEDILFFAALCAICAPCVAGIVWAWRKQ